VPAPAVIPAPRAYINVVAVKKLVVGFRDLGDGLVRGVHNSCRLECLPVCPGFLLSCGSECRPSATSLWCEANYGVSTLLKARPQKLL